MKAGQIKNIKKKAEGILITGNKQRILSWKDKGMAIYWQGLYIYAKQKATKVPGP